MRLSVTCSHKEKVLNGQSRLESNLKALRRLYPELADRIEASPDLPPETLFLTSTGHPNLRFPMEDGRLFALYPGPDPEFHLPDAEKNEVRGEDTATLLLGFGLGYLALTLYENSDPNHPLIFVEPDLAVLKAAFTWNDMGPLPASRKTYWATNEAEVNAAFERLQNDLVTKVFVSYRPLHSPHGKPVFDALLRKIRSLTYHVTGSAKFVEENGLLTATNSTLNLAHRITGQSVGKLFDRFHKVPAVLIGGGPSLEKNLHHLRGYVDRAVVLCADSAMRFTLAMGIEPHFVTSIDPSALNLKKFVGVPVPPHTTLVCPPVVNPKILDRFPGLTLFHLRGDQDPLWSEALQGDERQIKPVTTVALLSLHLALAMGCDPIILVGQDLSFPDNRTHAADFDTWTMANVSPRQLVTVRNMWAREVKTTTQFLGFAQAFESEIGRHRRVFVNATEYGIPLRGFSPMRFKDALNVFCSKTQDALKQYWWLGSTPGLDRSSALKELIGSVENHVRALKQMVRLGGKIPPRRTGEVPLNTKAQKAVDRLSAEILKTPASWFLVATTSATLLRWALRHPPRTFASLVTRNAAMAIEFADRLLKNGPKLLDALGVTLQRLRLLEAAEENWERAEWDGLRKQAVLLRKQGLLAVSQSVLQQVISAAADPQAVTARREVLLEMDQFPLVAAEAPLHEPENEAADSLRRTAAELEGDWRRFADSIRQKFGGEESDPESNLLEGARFYLRSGSPKNAGALLTEYLNRYGENDLTLSLRAELYMAGGRWPEAVGCFREAETRRPLNPESRHLLGKALIGGGAFQEAEALLREMCVSESAEPSVFESLAGLYLATSRPQEALRLLDKAKERFPDSPSIAELHRSISAAAGPGMHPND